MARRKKIKFRKGTSKRLLEFKARHRGVKPPGAYLEAVAVGSCKKCGAPITRAVYEKHGMYCPICIQYSAESLKRILGTSAVDAQKSIAGAPAAAIGDGADVRAGPDLDAGLGAVMKGTKPDHVVAKVRKAR